MSGYFRSQFYLECLCSFTCWFWVVMFVATCKVWFMPWSPNVLFMDFLVPIFRYCRYPKILSNSNIKWRFWLDSLCQFPQDIQEAPNIPMSHREINVGSLLCILSSVSGGSLIPVFTICPHRCVLSGDDYTRAVGLVSGFNFLCHLSGQPRCCHYLATVMTHRMRKCTSSGRTLSCSATPGAHLSVSHQLPETCGK